MVQTSTMKFSLLSFLIFLTLSVTSQTEFEELLNKHQLEFTMPDGFEEVPVKENPDMYYNYAMKLIGQQFEVRYTIMSLRKMCEDYKDSKNDSTRMMIDPNKLHKSMVIANILNISQINMAKDPIPQIAPFPPKSVKEEFGCEYGGTAFFKVNSTFSIGYKYCSFVVLHKENVADVYISFLGKKGKKIPEFMLKAFYALRFVNE